MIPVLKKMKKREIENATSIVIIDDNCGYNSSKIINDIQIFKAGNFEGGKLSMLNNGKLVFPFKKLEKNINNHLDNFFNIENLFSKSIWANTFRKKNYYNHFIDDGDYEKSLIFVKKSFLDKSKKVIFNNIKHLYYYCIRKTVEEESPIFWNKNERFKIPDSIKIDNLETLHLSCGRKTSLKDLEKICGSNLKILVVEDMLIGDFSMPKMPKLEKMLINYGNITWELIRENNKKLTNFRNFENVPNLSELDIDIEYDQKYGIELNTSLENSKIKKLKINHLNPQYVNEIIKIKSLSDLDISLWNTRSKVTEKDFEFLKKLKNLKKIKLSGGSHSSISIDYKKVMTFINKNIEDIEIDIVYKEDNHKIAYNCIAEINNRFRNLKKLIIDCNSIMIDNYKRSGFKADINSCKFKEDKEILEYSNKKTKLKSTHDKYKFQLDFKYFNKLKNLELLGFSEESDFKIIVINENELFKLPNLKRIVAGSELFSINFFEKIIKRKLGILTGRGDYGEEAGEILYEKY